MEVTNHHASRNQTLMSLEQRKEAMMRMKERYFKEKKIDEKKKEIEDRISQDLSLRISNHYKDEWEDNIEQGRANKMGNPTQDRKTLLQDSIYQLDKTLQSSNIEAEFHPSNESEVVDTSRLLGEIAFSLESKLRDSIRREVNKEIKHEKMKKRSNYREIDQYLAEEIASKTCAICFELMTPPDHSPYILFPCGHTYCMPCCKSLLKQHGNKCPECRSVIQSHALNLPLKQLIESFVEKENELKKKQQKDVRASAHDDHSIASLWKNKATQPVNYEDDRILNVISSQVSQENIPVAEKYYTDFKKLSLRSQLLQTELKEIHNEVSQLGGQEIHIKNRLEAVQKEEDAIKKDIKILMQGLEELDQELERLRSKEHEIHQKKRNSTKKIEMISGTLQSVESQKEKSLVLLQRFIPGIQNLMNR